ncbi:hypothetical protein D3C74_40210 [compost metagenome]
MVEGVTLPKIAEKLEIHTSIAFYWRHKILNALRSLGFAKLRGIIESDETYFLESDKGKKDLTHRKPRKRGGKAKKRGISSEQISIVVAHDRNGTYYRKWLGVDESLLMKSTNLWMDRFNGVATKYIDNYLFWFRFLEMHKQLDKNLRRKTMILDACKQANFTNTAKLRA